MFNKCFLSPFYSEPYGEIYVTSNDWCTSFSLSKVECYGREVSKVFHMQIVTIQTHDLSFKMYMGKMSSLPYSCLLRELWSLNILTGDSKKSINSTKSIKIIDLQEMVLTRVLDYDSWDLKVWSVDTALSQQIITRCL